MRILLDTMVVIGAFGEAAQMDGAISKVLRKIGTRARAVVSTASLWEIAIKKGKGGLTAPDNLPELLEELAHVDILDIGVAHVWRTLSLPRFAQHKDPFDRLLVAQALEENLTIATIDDALALYGAKLLRP